MMITCTICNETFILVNPYVKHLTNHFVSVYLCPMPFCERKFPHVESLRSHLNRYKHLEEGEEFVSANLNSESSDVYEESVTSNLNSISSLNPFQYGTTTFTSSVTDIRLNENTLKIAILKLIVGVYNENSFSRKKILSVLKNCFEVFSKSISHILSLLNNGNETIITYLQELLDCCTLSSEYKFLKELNKNGIFTYPIRHLVKSENVAVNKNNKVILKSKKVFIQLIDLQNLFQNLFNKTNFLLDIISYIDKVNNDNKKVNFIQSEAWKNKIENIDCNEETLLLPIFVYFDEFEPNNTLGSRSNKNKIGAVYVMIPCMPPSLQSKLCQIFLAMLFNSSEKKVLKTHANRCLFAPLIQILNILQSTGITVCHPKYKTVKLVTSLILGDNLGLNQILGFNEGFQANVFCRICRCDKNITQKCVEKPIMLRNKLNYEDDVQIANSKLTGIKENSIWNDLDNFHVTENYSLDVMHDVLEGVAHYVMIRVLRNFIENQFLDVELLNLRIETYDFTNCSNKPPIISKDTLLSTNKIRYTAAEMYTFIMHFNCLIGDLVPINNECWRLYLLLREIVSIINLDQFDLDFVSYIENIIKEHHELFMSLFKEHLRPKFHFLVHYPYVMSFIGLIQDISSIRFEAKHQVFKEVSRVCKNRKNLLHTLAMKHQIKISHLLLSYNEISFESTQIICSKVRISKKDESFKNMFQLNANKFEYVKWIQYLNIKYKPGCVVLSGHYEDDLPVFNVIKHIVIIENEYVFCIQELYTAQFDPHMQIYEVEETEIFSNILFSKLKKLRTFHTSKINNKLAINNKY